MSVSLLPLSRLSAIACRFGASGFGCRPSSRGLGGFVAVLGFKSLACANLAARVCALSLPARCGGCVVRRSGPWFLVSVPVLPASVPASVRRGASLWRVGAPPALRLAFLAGGVWGIWAAPVCAPAPVWASGWAGRFAASVAPAAGQLGFSGSRSLGASFAGLVSALVRGAVSVGQGVAVGCAPGLDALVRASCSSASVFRVAGSGPGAFAARSISFVKSLARSGPGASLAVFPGRACPGSVVPSPCASLCFCGSGSGSWASAALAAGLGVPVVVFGLAASALPQSWGRWVRAASSGPWACGFRLVPPVQQLSLF